MGTTTPDRSENDAGAVKPSQGDREQKTRTPNPGTKTQTGNDVSGGDASTGGKPLRS
jgi:hypothetical protein